MYIPNEYDTTFTDGSAAIIITSERFGVYPVIIDIADFPMLSKHQWQIVFNKQGHMVISTNLGYGKKRTLGGMILDAKPGQRVHKINGSVTDFRRANLWTM
jgi:hypothetical protein